MELRAAETLAKALMAKHGLYNWSFKWTNSKRQFGICHESFRGNHIALSKPITLLNNEHEVNNVILHEIAHALVGNKHGHDRVWKAMCIKIGARPERCYSTKDVTQPTMRYVAICGGCGIKHQRARKIKSGNMFSCKCQNSKPWRERLILTFVDTKTNRICTQPSVTVPKIMYTVIENGQKNSFTCDSELISFVKRHIKENRVEAYSVLGISDATEYLELCADMEKLIYIEN
jgi:predicted SprT family Zn-dependent metalloprotease